MFAHAARSAAAMPTTICFALFIVCSSSFRTEIRFLKRHVAGQGPRLRPDRVPNIVEPVARHVARLLILGPVIKRFSEPRPLLRAVIARNNRPVAAGLIGGTRVERRPVRR